MCVTGGEDNNRVLNKFIAISKTCLFSVVVYKFKI